jgi:hypothetical protein
VNTDELASALFRAEDRVLEIQTKLHRWARDEPHRRFDDLFNLVADPAFLLVAWDRVRGNKGARTAGVDGRTAVSIQVGQGVEDFLDGLRTSLKDRSFRPLPVRERMIPKANGKLRRLGIAGSQIVQEPGPAHDLLDVGDREAVHTGRARPLVSRDPTERHDQRRRVVHEVEQVIEPAARIGHRPTMKLGLHLRYPRPRPDKPWPRSIAVRRRVFRHCSVRPFSIPLPPFPMCAGSPRPGVLIG